MVFIFILYLSNKIVVIITNYDIIAIKFFDKIILCKITYVQNILCVIYVDTNFNYYFKLLNKVN